MNGPRNLVARVVTAAATALRVQGHVDPLDVMLGIGWLHPNHVRDWQSRRLPCLEAALQVAPDKLAAALRAFRAWTEKTGLQASAADHFARTAARERLRFTATGDPEQEAIWQTRWLSPDLTTGSRKRLAAKASKAPELVVFRARNPDWQCHRCAGTGDDLFMEPAGPACLPCAGLGDLEYLPAGDALLTRRARAASERQAVVVLWSRTRNRYERIGCLVEPAALAQARASLDQTV